MSLVDEITGQMKTAMKAKDKPRLTALRGIRAAFLEAMKADGRDALPDEEAIAILRKLAKSRVESITAYTEAGRDDLVADEQAELTVIEEFLPKLADEATTRVWAQDAIAKTGASSMKEMGKVMGALMGAHKAELDGKLAQKVIKELLG